ncbi:MAG: NADH-quinone oxidoreductase subunit M [Pirellulales bacterium]|nr:NADH-quinone oxidoreductase subunit M [Pirellulales bacterium]
MNVLLLTTLLLPLAGALLIGGGRSSARWTALAVALAVLALAVALAARFPGDAAPFAATDWDWLGWSDAPIDVRFHVALDGLSIWLFALTALLGVAAVLVGWEAIREQAPLYYRLLLVLETGMLGVFVARDIILFYIFFEFTLVPLFFLIGIWGSRQRRWAATKFFLFTLAGSLLTFIGLLAIVLWVYYHPADGTTPGRMTFSIAELTASLRDRPMDPALQVWIFAALFAGFAVKAPLWPLHTWLPLAHVEAPAAGSVLLAGVLLKVGVYGFARFSLPMLPAAAAALMPWLLWISLAGIIYGSLVALAQSDLKRLVAYSSVGHLGFCTLGIFAADRLGVEGGTLQLINHGLATGGLFAVVGMLHERFHTREIADFGGLARRMPRLAFFAMVFTLSSVALPGLAGFAGEFPLLLGVFQRGWAEPLAGYGVQLRIIAVSSLAGVVLGAWYMLWMYQRVFFGIQCWGGSLTAAPTKSSPLSLGEWRGGREADVSTTENNSIRDLSTREVFCLAPLAATILWIGAQPSFFIERMRPTLDELIAPVTRACETASNISTDHWPLTTDH